MDREHSGENCLEDNVDDASDDMSISNTNDGLKFENMWKHVMDTWQRQRVEAIVQLLCYIVNLLWLLNIQAMIIGKPLSSINAERDALRHKLMCELTTNEVICRDILRMGPVAFAEFCGKLRATGLLKDFRRATVEEQVAKFLQILGQNFRNRALGFFFHRSGETISRHFHNVLRAVVALEAEFLNQPTGADVPPQILNNNRFYPYFKNCVGALDGTHIRVKVPRELAPRFRGRKEWPTQNVLAACSFDMKFTYVLPGWEGTASDSRILKNAMDREDKLLIPQGKFYLVDAGLPLRSGLIAPYRGVRYHLNEYSRRGPQNAKELFNHRHASLYENLIAEVDRELMHAEADHHVGTSGLATDADYRIGIKNAKEKKDSKPESSMYGRDHVVWTNEMDNVLINAMLEEDHKGNRPEGTWNTRAFDNMLQVLRAAFGPIIQKSNIKNRMKTLKRTFAECKDLFHGLSGFAWNPVTKLFEATFDVWEQLIQEKPEARKWMQTPINNYDKLYELYGNQRATGEYAESAREKVTDNNMNSPEPSLHSQGTSSRCSKCKVSMMEMLEKQYERLNSGIERVSEVLERGNAIAEKSLAILESGRPHYYKEEELFTELELIGVHPDFVMTAYCYLSKNPSATRSFFGVPRARRLEWLMRVVNDK
ncbi:hypothetical protein GH714_020123 [Hevea brasiliensis]|uniref:Myb/SANT-like domain-containing protein n=1 Tax=Hevea brasiliensis TaxID=3981 RepID=A0A6A6MC26_HEVBR|nr:hypothetical protein GH714_020123 [Hevea brasiliensis]